MIGHNYNTHTNTYLFILFWQSITNGFMHFGTSFNFYTTGIRPETTSHSESILKWRTVFVLSFCFWVKRVKDGIFLVKFKKKLPVGDYKYRFLNVLKTGKYLNALRKKKFWFFVRYNFLEYTGLKIITNPMRYVKHLNFRV